MHNIVCIDNHHHAEITFPEVKYFEERYIEANVFLYFIFQDKKSYGPLNFLLE